MNLNGLQNLFQMNTKDLSGIEIVKRMRLRNTVAKQITTFPCIRRKLLTEKKG